MHLDTQAMFSDQQTLVAAVGNVLATNSMDLGAPGSTALAGTAVKRDFGRGSKPKLLCQITEQVDSAGGAATVEFQVIQGTGVDGNGQINAGTEVLARSAAIPEATLVPGYQVPVELPPGIDERYLSMRYVIAGEDVTAGKVTAALLIDRQEQG